MNVALVKQKTRGSTEVRLVKIKLAKGEYIISPRAIREYGQWVWRAPK